MNVIKINPAFINKSEIARKVKYSPEYVRLLLKGERTNPRALAKVLREINKQLNVAA